MTGHRDRWLVIGAGPVGLAMAKALKARGIAYDQVDANDGIGGNWRNGVFKATHIISSKRSTAYADYPMPASYPDFPSAGQLLAYLESYALAHGLAHRVELRRTVERAVPAADHAWRVTFADGEQRTYKGLLVCNGHHWDKRWPDLSGFTGKRLHSRDYREAAELAGKRVLVVGGGNSGCDIASDAARVAESCDWSLRDPSWFLPKTVFGRPLMDLPIWQLPVFAQRLVVRAMVRALIGRHAHYGLEKPSHRLFDRHPTYGAEALGYIRQGRIRPRGAIESCDGQTIRFKDGSSGDYDMVVAATGFHMSFPFLPAGLVEVVNGAPQVLGGAFPPGVRNLAIVGASQPRSGFGSIVTPAVNLFARMIKMQDELEQPLGDLLAWIGHTPPADILLDPASTRREIWLADRFLWLLPWQSRRMARAMTRRVPASIEATGGTADRPSEPANGRPVPADHRRAA